MSTEPQSETGDVRLRRARPDDVPHLVALNARCFPSMAEEEILWSEAQLLNHQRVFPEGQIVAVRDGRVVGAVASLIVNLGNDDYRPHTYAGITDGGFFHNHDPGGDSLYGADVYVDPDARGNGIGHQLYEARRQLCQRLNLRRIVAGGRMTGYAEVADTLSVDDYVREIEQGKRVDPVLSFQLREGFVVRGSLRQYIVDPLSCNYATFILTL